MCIEKEWAGLILKNNNKKMRFKYLISVIGIRGTWQGSVGKKANYMRALFGIKEIKK